MSTNVGRQWTRQHGTLLLAVSLEPQEIGRRIASAREKKGWTQLTFALEANVSPSTVQRWEGGKLPPVRELMRIAEVLGVAVDDFVQPEVEAATITDLVEEVVAARRQLDRVLELLERDRADFQAAAG